MTPLIARWLSFWERFLPWLVLTYLLLFTYAWFFQVPYAGFNFSPSSGRVSRLYVAPTPSALTLQQGDRLVQIGPVAWKDFATDERLTLFDDLQPGQVIAIVVERDSHFLTIPWVFPGPTYNEVVERLSSEWFLAYIFWLAGTITFLFLRPKDTPWRLFLAFNFLTTVWLMAGTFSRWHVWGSPAILQAGVWLSVPIYWHWHWVFPQPLRHSPPWLWRVIYGLGGLLAIVDGLQILPLNLYLVGFLGAIAGSIGLLGAHFVFQPKRRGDIGLLLLAVGLAMLPSLVIGLAETIRMPIVMNAGALLTFPLVPFAYLYVAYRRRFGRWEIRANQLVGLYVFAVLLMTIFIPALAIAEAQPNFAGKTVLLGLATALIAAILTATSLRPFQRAIEQYLLGMRLPATRLMQTYTERITVSLERSLLIHLLQAEVLPSLLVRQSVVLHLDVTGRFSVFCALGVEDAQLPTAEDVAQLLPEATTEKYPLRLGGEALPCPWARVVLPLMVGRKPIGLWLLGRRDPDDFYAQTEILILRSLAHQTAIALTNIIQAEQLQALYLANIEQVENERANLAWDLHDNVLSQLAVLKNNLDAPALSPQFLQHYQVLIARIRETISGLRSATLNFGLYMALSALVDDLAEHVDAGPEIVLDLPKTDQRYELRVEQHVYRIVQQACENALRHAQPHRIRIHGVLAPERIDLTVEDDGVGFVTDASLELAWLLMHKHFGLASMRERAILIGADIQIDSAVGRGTAIRVAWKPEATG